MATTYSMTFPTNLLEIVLGLDSIQQVNNLKRVSKDIHEKLTSPEFAKLYHQRRHIPSKNPPEKIYTPEERSWILEYSFLPQEFFFPNLKRDKIFFYPYGACIDAYIRKDREIAAFLEKHFKLGISPGARKYNIRARTKGKLTREQAIYAAEAYSFGPDDYYDALDYIRLLAYHGNIEIFEEIISSKRASEGTLPSLPKLDKYEESYRVLFAGTMISYGRDGLLEAYNRGEPDIYLVDIRVYHPDQWTILGIDKKLLSLLEGASISPEELYTRVKKLGDYSYLRNLPQRDEFIPWVITHHPEEVEVFFSEVTDNFDLEKFRGYPLVTSPSSHRISGSWQEILPYIGSLANKSWITAQVIYAITTPDFPYLLRLLEWNSEEVIDVAQKTGNSATNNIRFLLPHLL